MTRTLKLVVLGEGCVGKSAFALHFTQQRFVDSYDPTIEDVYTRQVNINNTEVLVEMLDTAGYEQYSATRSLYMKSGDGFLFIYSITYKTSFEELQTYIEHTFTEKDLDSVPMVIIGNKCDLETERVVQTQAGENMASIYKAAFFETSTRFGINVYEAVESLAIEILKTKHENKDTEKRKQCIVF